MSGADDIDMTGGMCGCGGEYAETDIHDDWHGVLHCTTCGNEVERWTDPAAAKDMIVAAVRKGSRDVAPGRYRDLLDEYSLESFSKKCLGEMSRGRLEALLRDIIASE